jgi:YD repeat-containing protein
MRKIILLLMALACSLITPALTAHADDDTFYRYDTNGNLSARHSSNGDNMYYQHDVNGNLTSKYDDQGNVTYYSHDANGNISRVTHVDAAEPKATPTPTFSRPRPIRSAPSLTPAPTPVPQIMPKPQVVTKPQLVTEITPQYVSSAADIRIYLHDDGFSDVSQTDIEKIVIYLKEHKKSIAEIGSHAALEVIK